MQVPSADWLSTYRGAKQYAYVYRLAGKPTGCANKNNPLEKKLCISAKVYGFGRNFQNLYASTDATYPANFIEIIDTIKQIQQFKI